MNYPNSNSTTASTEESGELFVLTDEQILEIEPQPVVTSDPPVSLGAGEWPLDSARNKRVATNEGGTTTPQPIQSELAAPALPLKVASEHTMVQSSAQAGTPAALEPPKWLAARSR